MKNPKIVAFAASNSKKSINKEFAAFAANSVDGADVLLLDLNDFEMPIYSVDRENEDGFPQLAIEFKRHIKDSDAIIISFAEHNGSYSAAFKNIFDWISRLEKNVWEDKPMLLLSTSPGARGASTVLGMALDKFKRMNSNRIASFSLPSFDDNFSTNDGVLDSSLDQAFQEQLSVFKEAI